jgi:hypothetical protein
LSQKNKPSFFEKTYLVTFLPLLGAVVVRMCRGAEVVVLLGA